jgi:uncharacterized protein YndB with AHSA1/START domain
VTVEPSTGMEVRRTISVPLSPEQAFELFTARMTEFWPPEHSIGSTPFAQVVVEPRTGGRWFERGTDDSECDWGRVAAWEPGRRVVLLWQIGADWTFDPDFETEVDVTFTEEPDGRTRVDLVHRNLERFGEHAASMREVFESPGGWNGTLDRFIAVAG